MKISIKHFAAFVLLVTMTSVAHGQSCDVPKLQSHPYKQFVFQPASIVRWSKEVGVDAYEFRRGDGTTFIWQDCSVTADKGWMSFINYQYSYFNVPQGMGLQVRAYCIPYCSKVEIPGMGFTFGYDPINLNNPANWSGWSNFVTIK